MDRLADTNPIDPTTGFPIGYLKVGRFFVAAYQVEPKFSRVHIVSKCNKNCKNDKYVLTEV